MSQNNNFFFSKNLKEINNHLKTENLILQQKLETAENSNCKVNHLKIFK